MLKPRAKRWTEVPVDWRAIQQEIDTVPHRMKTAQKTEIAAKLGLSIHQLHSALRHHFGPKKTIKKRSFKKKEDQEAYDRNRRISYLVAEHKEKLKKAGDGERELSTKRILTLFAGWGIEEAKLCNEGTINHILREEMGYRQKTPRTRHEPKYALQEVQVDFSFSKYFSIVNYDSELGDYILKASKTVLRYKEGDKRMRPLLGVIMDSYSRLRFHLAMAASGESGVNTTSFLIEFFNREPDELVFAHVGWMFKMDNGPLAKSQEGKSFFKSINRPVETSKPYEKTGIGKAERGWPLIWAWEQEVVSNIGVNGLIPLGEYNTLLLAECIRQQNEFHLFYYQKRRVDMYQQSILAQNPRPEVINTDLRHSVYTVLERTVGTDQIIRIGKEPYEIPVYSGDHYTTGRRIRVHMHRDGRMMGELIDRHAPLFEIQPFNVVPTGTFRSKKQTFADQLNKEIKEGRAITDKLRDMAENTRKKGSNPGSGVRRLMPQLEAAEVTSPFTRDAAQDLESAYCISKFEALTLVADLLKRENLELTDELGNYFDEFVTNVKLHRDTIQQEVRRFIQILNETMTGT